MHVVVDLLLTCQAELQEERAALQEARTAMHEAQAQAAAVAASDEMPCLPAVLDGLDFPAQDALLQARATGGVQSSDVACHKAARQNARFWELAQNSAWPWDLCLARVVVARPWPVRPKAFCRGMCEAGHKASRRSPSSPGAWAADAASLACKMNVGVQASFERMR